MNLAPAKKTTHCTNVIFQVKNNGTDNTAHWIMEASRGKRHPENLCTQFCHDKIRWNHTVIKYRMTWEDCDVFCHLGRCSICWMAIGGDINFSTRSRCFFASFYALPMFLLFRRQHLYFMLCRKSGWLQHRNVYTVYLKWRHFGRCVDFTARWCPKNEW